MQSSRSGRMIWIALGAVLVAVAPLAAWLVRPSDSPPPVSDVAPSQTAALEAIRAAAPVTFKLDSDGRVIHLAASGSTMTDAVAASLRDLPDLKDLKLDETAIGAKGLQAIGSLSQLESLRLTGTPIADEDLKPLANARALRHIFLTGCPVGDAAVETLKDLPELRVVDLSRTRVTDGGLAQLGNVATLERLYLTGTDVSGTGLAGFPESNRIELLNLSGTKLSLEGIGELKRFENLTSLYLDRVKLDNEMLERLMDLLTRHAPHLAALFLSETPLTDQAVEPLESLAELPDLSLVSLHGTRISKRAFKQLAARTPDVRYQVDYDAKE